MRLSEQKGFATSINDVLSGGKPSEEEEGFCILDDAAYGKCCYDRDIRLLQPVVIWGISVVGGRRLWRVIGLCYGATKGLANPRIVL